MRHALTALWFGAALWAAPSVSEERAQVYFLGEIHDNPGHHARQAEWVADIAPKALVFEMIPETHVPGVRAHDDLAAFGQALAWGARGWPDFMMYAPIFEAAPEAKIYGAGVGRDQLMTIRDAPLAQAFGADAAEFGLDQPLPADQQEARNALQMAAHCDAMPAEMLPMMVDMQRWRDAALARAAEQALDETGGPVAVITGNGHARRDWGAPTMMADATIFVLGQGEGTRPPPGRYDALAYSDPVDRPDPCDAFK